MTGLTRLQLELAGAWCVSGQGGVLIKKAQFGERECQGRDQEAEATEGTSPFLRNNCGANFHDCVKLPSLVVVVVPTSGTCKNNKRE